MGERSAPIEGCGFAKRAKRAKCPHEDRVNTSPLRGRGVWGNAKQARRDCEPCEVSPQRAFIHINSNEVCVNNT